MTTEAFKLLKKMFVLQYNEEVAESFFKKIGTEPVNCDFPPITIDSLNTAITGVTANHSIRKKSLLFSSTAAPNRK